MGERGERNVLRGDSYASVDMAFNKAFDMPYSEAHNLAVRLEIFNLTNTPYFDTASLNLSLEDPATFGQYSAMLGGPRRMQVSLVRLLTSAPGSIRALTAERCSCRTPRIDRGVPALDRDQQFDIEFLREGERRGCANAGRNQG